MNNQNSLTTGDFVHLSLLVLPSQIASVYALLGASALSGLSGKAPATIAAPSAAAESAAEQSADGAEASQAAAVDETEVDTAGWPWSADLHASTRGKTKEGLWRMKVGVARPDPKPGFPIEGAGSTSTASDGAAGSSQSEAAQAPAAGPADDDDEFAAFRAAAEKVDAAGAAAAASVPARKWTDADLGALCNQAAVKLGDPAPIKELIGEYVAEGEVAHSRNIAEDKRAAFAAAVEAKAGITFAG